MQNPVALDRFDQLLLATLQRDASLTNAELGERISLSASQVSRRRSRLEEAGVIAGYHARLDGAALGVNTDVFVRVTLTAHREDTATEFASFLRSLAMVRGAWALTGDADYLLHVKVASLEALSQLVNRQLLPHPNVQFVRSDIALDCIVVEAPLQVPGG